MEGGLEKSGKTFERENLMVKSSTIARIVAKIIGASIDSLRTQFVL